MDVAGIGLGAVAVSPPGGKTNITRWALFINKTSFSLEPASKPEPQCITKHKIQHKTNIYNPLRCAIRQIVKPLSCNRQLPAIGKKAQFLFFLEGTYTLCKKGYMHQSALLSKNTIIRPFSCFRKVQLL